MGTRDTYLAWDYPSDIANRYYSELCLLAAYLLAGAHRFRTVLPSWYVSKRRHTGPRLLHLGWPGSARHITAWNCPLGRDSVRTYAVWPRSLGYLSASASSAS